MITRRDYWRRTAQHVADEGVAKETCDLAAAEAADQSPTAFRVFMNFNDDKMPRSGINTHHTLRCVCVCVVCSTWGEGGGGRHRWWYQMNILFRLCRSAGHS